MSEEMNAATISRIAAEASVSGAQVMAVAKLLKDGNTVPFIARYRKEAQILEGVQQEIARIDTIAMAEQEDGSVVASLVIVNFTK